MDVGTLASALLGNAVDIRGKLIPGFLILTNILAFFILTKQVQMDKISKLASDYSVLSIFFVIIISQVLGGAALKVSFVTLSGIWSKPGPVEFYKKEKNSKLVEFYKIEYKGYEEYKSPNEELFDHAKETIIYSANNARAIELEARANFAAGLVIPLLLFIFNMALYFRTLTSRLLSICSTLFVLSIYIIDFKKVVTYSEPKSIYTQYYQIKQAKHSPKKASSMLIKPTTK